MASRSLNRTLQYAIGLFLASTAGAATAPSAAETGGLPSREVHAQTHNDVYEMQLIRALANVTGDQLDSALSEVEKLVEANPRFKLAQVVYADLLLAKAQPISGFGNLSDAPNEEIQDLLAEARARWRHYASPPPAVTLPEYLLQMEQRQRTAVVVDLKQSRMFVFNNENGQPRLVDDYYVSIGKNGAVKELEGDKKTPVGVYFVTRYLPPGDLPDYYGAGAFPLNYPNAWDRFQKKTGFGIWLHGNPLDTFSRPPRASDGCVTLSNADLKAIMPLIDTGRTPVLIANGITWVPASEIETLRKDFKRILEQWRQDWQSLDTTRYLANYSRDFQAEGKDFAAWAQETRDINRQKSFIEVKLSDLSIFRYPGDTAVMVVTFLQGYRSDDVMNTGEKRQYWHKEKDGRWRIIYEGPV